MGKIQTVTNCYVNKLKILWYQGEAKVRERTDKTWVLTLIQGLEKTHFWTSFSAFPKKVVMNKFVAREVPDNHDFLNFEKTRVVIGTFRNVPVPELSGTLTTLEKTKVFHCL